MKSQGLCNAGKYFLIVLEMFVIRAGSGNYRLQSTITIQTNLRTDVFH